MLEYRTKMAEDGRIVLPAACRKALRLEPGMELVIKVEEEEVRIFSVAQAIKRAQILVNKYTKGKKGLTDELLATRRDESKHE